MPWAPREDAEHEIRDARLDPFRERAGVLRHDDEDGTTHVFLRAETHWSRTGGHLWWSRWSAPYEVIHCYVRGADGQVTKWPSTGVELVADLDLWRNGSFRYAGGLYGVQWQDDATSRWVRDELFGSPNGSRTTPS